MTHRGLKYHKGGRLTRSFKNYIFGEQRASCFKVSHLADVHLVRVFASRGSVGGKDGRAVTVRVSVD